RKGSPCAPEKRPSQPYSKETSTIYYAAETYSGGIQARRGGEKETAKQWRLHQRFHGRVGLSGGSVLS
ncbi:unnamed protein product, partial [Ascophyllum nodosum]